PHPLRECTAPPPPNCGQSCRWGDGGPPARAKPRVGEGGRGGTPQTPGCAVPPPSTPHRAPGTGHNGEAYGSNLYPSPRTVTRYRGAPGSGSIFARNRFTCTSSVLVSPT